MLRCLCLALALLAMASGARAGGPSFLVYSVNEKGRVLLNSTPLDTLTGAFNPQDLDAPKGTDRWTDFVVDGADRYSLRLDGRVEKNGAKLQDLPFFVSTFLWRRLIVDGGAVHALRTDGLLSVNGITVSFKKQGFLFQDLLAQAGRVYVLRADGSVFVDDQPLAVTDFDGTKSKLENKEGKGVFGESLWVRMVANPVSGEFVALRGDGQMQSWAVGDPEPTVLPDLPFPKKAEKLRGGHRYVDLEFSADGTWYVLRRDGRVYSSADVVNELVDYPGKTKTSKKAESFVDLAVLNGDFWAVRWDGELYRGTSTDLQVDLTGKRYVRLALGDTAPDLTDVDNSLPRAAVYSVKAIEGETIALPLLANDLDQAEDQLFVAPHFGELPAGASFDAGTRTVNWPSAGPVGKYSFHVSVDDGTGAPAQVFTYRIRILPVDTSPKNRKPVASKVAPTQVLVGVPFALPILVADRDGDPLTVTPVMGVGAFAQGASYDAMAGTLLWAPQFQDVGKTFAKLQVSDGVATRTLRLKFDVRNPLIFSKR